jgi:CRP-like cAMP-binding protein
MQSTIVPNRFGTAWTYDKNRLLAALDPADLQKISSQLEVDDYASGQILYEPQQAARYVYFPFSCVVSIVNTVAGGNSVEVGTVGNEGMAGLAVYLDSDATPHRTLVQVPGQMARLRVEAFRELSESSPRFRTFLNRYTLAFLAQVSQTAACNRAHNIDERCARWLLMTHDRVDSDSFSLTHEFLAFMLGVRRAGVTVAAGILQKAGLITYRRGNITIVNREGLEAAACECYHVVWQEFEKLLSAQQDRKAKRRA